MEDETMTQRSTGVGFTDLLAILFIGLKLTGCIQWSWIWVLIPVYGVILAFIVSLVALLLDD